MSAVLKLYVKVWCPWCIRAEHWLREHGYAYTRIDIEEDRAARDEMVRLSGQRLTPTLVTGNGEVLPDFGPEELAGFLQKLSIKP